MDRSFVQFAGETEDAAAALQVFLDATPGRDPYIAASIEELLALSSALNTLDRVWRSARYGRVPSRVTDDADLVLRSLQCTLDALQDMFGETRFSKYGGAIPYEVIWETFSSRFRVDEGFSLNARLEMYSVFLKGIIDVLRGYGNN